MRGVYTVPRPGFELMVRDIDVFIEGTQVLKKVSCFVRSGELLAVMGPSGAGKSTLMSSVCGRLSASAGDVTLNGQPISRRLRRKIGYVLQQDAFFANLTLRQTLKYTAALRLPDSMPQAEKDKRIQEVVRMLSLNSCMDTAMGGGFVPGLSGGERKRASIACELLMKPSLLLVDEPTSGLDVVTALSIMRELKGCTGETGQTVVATIHQPSSQVFHMFDRVLLLSEGEVAYFGEAQKIVPFFSDAGYICGPSYNPADFILEKLKMEPGAHDKLVAATRSNRNSPDWRSALQEHHRLAAEAGGRRARRFSRRLSVPMTTLCTSSIEASLGQAGVFTAMDGYPSKQDGYDVENGVFRQNSADVTKASGPKWHTSFWTQLRTLTGRGIVESRARLLSAVKCVFTLTMAIFCGLLWFQLPRTEGTAQDRMGMLFYSTSFFAFAGPMDAIASIPAEKDVIIKERSAGMYRFSAYYFAKAITDVPLMTIHVTVFVVITYWMADLDPDPLNFCGHLLVMIIAMFTAYNMGMLIAVSMDRFDVAITAVNIAILGSMLAGGFYVSHFPSWLSWSRYASIIYYAYHATMEIEFRHGGSFRCSPAEVTTFPECLTNSTEHVLTGAAILDSMETPLPLWADIVILLGYGILFKILEYIVQRFLKNPIRID